MTEEQIATLIGRIVMNNEAQRLAMFTKITEQEAELKGMRVDDAPDIGVQNGKAETKPKAQPLATELD